MIQSSVAMRRKAAFLTTASVLAFATAMIPQNRAFADSADRFAEIFADKTTGGAPALNFRLDRSNLNAGPASHIDSISTSFRGQDVDLSPTILIDDSLGTTDSILDLGNTHESVLGLVMFDLSTGLIQGFCSGTLINARTVITAAHCVRPAGTDPSFEQNLGVAIVRGPDGLADLNVGDFVFTSSHVVPVEFDRDAFFQGYDISVLALSSRITDIAPSGLVGGAPDLGSLVTLVGFGTTGTGDPNDTLFDFRRRAATNTLDSIGFFAGSTLENGLLFTDFDDPENPGVFDFFGTPEATELEGTTGNGDSGGALFVEGENGELLLAGVTSGGFNPFFGGINAIGDVAFFTNVAAMRPFIDAMNPLIRVSALAGDGDWLDPARWTGGLIPANFDPLRDAGDPTLPAAFFEVTLDQTGTTSLSNAAVRIDTLALADSGAALDLDGAFLDVVDYVNVVNGSISLTASELDSGSLIIQGGSVTLDVDSLYVDASSQIDNGLIMTGGLLDLSGQALFDSVLMDGGATRIRAGGFLFDIVGSTIMDGELSVAGTLSTEGFLQTGGSVVVDAGGLVADASGVSTLLGGDMRINGEFQTAAFGLGGGILGGDGQLTSPLGLVQSGGLLDPGNSIGTLTIVGDLLQSAGATTRIEVDPTGNDLIRVLAAGDMGGNAVLDGEIVVDFANGMTIARGSELQFIETDTSLTSTATVTGTVANRSGVATVLRAGSDLAIEGNSASIVISALPYSDFAVTASQGAVAGALDSATNATSVNNARLAGVVGALDTLGVNGNLQTALEDMNPTQTFAFDRFSFQLGRVMANTLTQRAGSLRRGTHGGVETTGAGLGNIRLASGNATDRTIQAAVANAQAATEMDGASTSQAGQSGGGHPWESKQSLPQDIGVFFAADVIDGEFDQTNSRESFTGYYLTLGADKAIGDSALVGVAGTYATSQLDNETTVRKAQSDSWGISLYGSYFAGPLYFDGFASFFGHDFDTERDIRTTETRLAVANGDGDQFLAGFDAGAQFDLGLTSFGPVVRLRHSNADIDRVEETGAGDFGAILDDRKAKETVLDLGARGSFDFMGEAHNTHFFSQVTWQNRIGGDDLLITTASLVADPALLFTVPGARIDDSYGAYAMGIQSLVTDRMSIRVAFEGDFERFDASERIFSVGIKVGF